MAEVCSLSDAVWTGDLAAVEAAIREGIDVNVAERDRWPPLHLAIEQMEVEIARRLIDAGAAVNKDLGKGWTPLAHAADIESDAACQAGMPPDQIVPSLTKLLLDSGAVPTERAIEIARRYGNFKTLTLLLNGKREG